MKIQFLYILLSSLLILSCNQDKPKKIVESRNAFKEVVFSEFEKRDAICNEKEGYVMFASLDGMKINKGMKKTDNGYKLQKGKICDITFIDFELRIRLERIENGAYMLYYEYMRDSEDSVSNKIIRDVDKGKVVFTCDH